MGASRWLGAGTRGASWREGWTRRTDVSRRIRVTGGYDTPPMVFSGDSDGFSMAGCAGDREHSDVDRLNCSGRLLEFKGSARESTSSE